MVSVEAPATAGKRGVGALLIDGEVRAASIEAATSFAHDHPDVSLAIIRAWLRRDG
jgi:hypothetical protein